MTGGARMASSGTPQRRANMTCKKREYRLWWRAVRGGEGRDADGGVCGRDMDGRWNKKPFSDPPVRLKRNGRDVGMRCCVVLRNVGLG